MSMSMLNTLFVRKDTLKVHLNTFIKHHRSITYSTLYSTVYSTLYSTLYMASLIYWSSHFQAVLAIFGY